MKELNRYAEFLYAGAGNMVEYLDFFNIYIIGLIEGGFQFYFLAKILKRDYGHHSILGLEYVR